MTHYYQDLLKRIYVFNKNICNLHHFYAKKILNILTLAKLIKFHATVYFIYVYILEEFAFNTMRKITKKKEIYVLEKERET